MPEQITKYSVDTGVSPKDLQPANLDDVDRRILSLLHADARITNSALADELDIAASTCHGRVRRLLDAGVIRGFYADIDPVAVGLPLQAMISVSLQAGARGKIRDFIQQIRRRPQVMDVYFLAGADDFILHVEPQLVVLDQRQGLLEHVDEELFAGRQQQVQHVEDVGGERLARHVMERQLRPVELDVARLEDQSFVIDRHPATW